MSPHQDLASGNANARLNRELGVCEVGNDAKAGADRTLGVIFVKLRDAEDGNNRVADVLLDGAAMRFDPSAADLVIRLQDFGDLFWVEALA
jgi:hypothetical protein